MSKPQVPKNTEKSSRWAMTNLREWYDDYNDRNSSAKCPEELLSPEASKEVLNTWLCVFITETRGKNGEPYHPKTLQFLLSGILRHMKAQHAHYLNFMDKDDPSFRKFNVTLDNLLKSLRADGVGDEENQLWTSGVLNVDSPKGLQQVSTCLLCHRLIKRTCHFVIIIMSKTDYWNNFSFFFG